MKNVALATSWIVLKSDKDFTLYFISVKAIIFISNKIFMEYI